MVAFDHNNFTAEMFQKMDRNIREAIKRPHSHDADAPFIKVDGYGISIESDFLSLFYDTPSKSKTHGFFRSHISGKHFLDALTEFMKSDEYKRLFVNRVRSQSPTRAKSPTRSSPKK